MPPSILLADLRGGCTSEQMRKESPATFTAPALSAAAAKLSMVPSPAEDGKVMGQGPFPASYFLAGAFCPLCAMNCWILTIF